jgi:hypothetical protein
MRSTNTSSNHVRRNRQSETASRFDLRQLIHEMLNQMTVITLCADEARHASQSEEGQAVLFHYFDRIENAVGKMVQIVDTLNQRTLSTPNRESDTQNHPAQIFDSTNYHLR